MSELFEYSCVLAANAHNPTILNKDWVFQQGIVPQDPSWQVEPPEIVTPPHAELHFVNAVTIIVETPMMTVTARNGAPEYHEHVKSIARNYVEKLPHIPYQALGNNFKSIVEIPNATTALMDSLLSPIDFEGNLKACAIKYVLTDNSELVRSISISPVQIAKSGSTEIADALIIDANYHRPCDGYQRILAAIEKGNSDKEDFEKIVSMIVKRIG